MVTQRAKSYLISIKLHVFIYLFNFFVRLCDLFDYSSFIISLFQFNFFLKEILKYGALVPFLNLQLLNNRSDSLES